MNQPQPGWDRQTVPPAEPYGWVQWKGTDVCMDIHCDCGEIGHIHGEFAYYVQCRACGKTYFVNGHVELVLLTADEADRIRSERTIILVDEE